MIAVEAQWSLMDPWLLVAAPIVWLAFVWRMIRSHAALPAAASGPLEHLPRTMRVRLWFLPALLQTLALTAFAVALWGVLAGPPVSTVVLGLGATLSPATSAGIGAALAVGTWAFVSTLPPARRETRQVVAGTLVSIAAVKMFPWPSCWGGGVVLLGLVGYRRLNRSSDAG